MLTSERAMDLNPRPPGPEDVVVAVRKLNIVFKAPLHRSWSWRDSFTRLVNQPIDSLFGQQERIYIARDLSFDVRRKERVGILGVNGVGKTSLCRCIAGIYAPSAGTVKVSGRARAVFDTHVGILPDLTGRENAELLAEFLYPDRANKSEIVEEALEFSGLGKFIDVPFRLYSNGMQTRLCLSLVTALPSDLLVLDEVFDGADAFFRERAQARVLKIMRESGAVIFVSHSEEQIRTACNRVLVLQHGQIAYDGNVEGGLRFYAALRPRTN